MTFDTALAHFKTQRNMANALGIKEQAVGQWKKSGRVPMLRALQLQELTKGKLRIDASVYALPRGKSGNGRAAHAAG